MQTHDSIQRITPRVLAQAVPGTHSRWWERRMQRLRSLGLVRRVGRYNLGSPSAIAAAVMAGRLEDEGGHR